MRLLGIDYGTKRVGIALSDDGAVMAFPEAIFKNDKNLLKNISELIKEKEVSKIIIGESKDYKMNDNLIMEEVNKFADELKKETVLEVIFHPEFMTSMQVSRERHHAETPREQNVRGEKAKEIDAAAATIILQSYIDSSKTN